jgi:hypothetical protein
MKKWLLLIGLMLLPTLVMAKDVTLSWDASPTPSVVEYGIYMADNPDMDNATKVATTDTLTVQIPELPNEEVQYFAVKAYDAKGFESVYSNVVNAPAHFAPEAPSNLQSVEIYIQIKIN